MEYLVFLVVALAVWAAAKDGVEFAPQVAA